jgi:hypothetical protein
MKARKTLKNILAGFALVGVAALGNVSCYSHPEYNYDGKIGDEKVTYLELNKISCGCLFPIATVLSVTKQDGRVIDYIDCDGPNGTNLKLERVSITKEGITVDYNIKDVIGKPVVEEAQKQFDNYLSEIKAAKIKQGLENLK